MRLIGKEVAFGAAEQGLQHNNGMHPTGQSVNVIRQIERLRRCLPAGDTER